MQDNISDYRQKKSWRNIPLVRKQINTIWTAWKYSFLRFTEIWVASWNTEEKNSIIVTTSVCKCACVCMCVCVHSSVFALLCCTMKRKWPKSCIKQLFPHCWGKQSTIFIQPSSSERTTDLKPDQSQYSTGGWGGKRERKTGGEIDERMSSTPLPDLLNRAPSSLTIIVS